MFDDMELPVDAGAFQFVIPAKAGIQCLYALLKVTGFRVPPANNAGGGPGMTSKGRKKGTSTYCLNSAFQ
jgi:hypothetical protein